jgi:hypothetical protein
MSTLSPQVRAAAEVAVEIVRQQIELRGLDAKRRDASHVEPQWWTTPSSEDDSTRQGKKVFCP